jgi:UDP-glucuronate decarboxylase
MLFTSSIRVTERFDRDGPHACYITGKIIGENLCLTYNQECGIDVKVARLYNTYGPRMALNDSRVIPQFVLRALRGEPLKIVGDGLQRDSFCYVDDMLDGLIAYMNSDVKLGPMEFGYPSPISIIDLAQLVVRLAGSSSPIEFNGVDRPAEEMEIKHRRPVPDIGEAREKLGWNPQTTLEEGLPRIIAYYRERL